MELYRERTALARVSWNPNLYNPLLRRRLGRIRARTLLCWGEHDRVTPLACAKVWQAEIPGATLLTFADSGHVRADRAMKYGDVRKVLEQLHMAGATVVGMGSQDKEEKK